MPALNSQTETQKDLELLSHRIGLSDAIVATARVDNRVDMVRAAQVSERRAGNLEELTRLIKVNFFDGGDNKTTTLTLAAHKGFRNRSNQLDRPLDRSVFEPTAAAIDEAARTAYKEIFPTLSALIDDRQVARTALDTFADALRTRRDERKSDAIEAAARNSRIQRRVAENHAHSEFKRYFTNPSSEDVGAALVVAAEKLRPASQDEKNYGFFIEKADYVARLALAFAAVLPPAAVFEMQAIRNEFELHTDAKAHELAVAPTAGMSA